MSIATSLFTDSQSRLYRWIFGQPQRDFHLSELRRLTGLGSASLQRELRKLSEVGLVVSERLGNLRRFRANSQSPVFAELVALTRKVLGVEPLLRDALLPLVPQLHAAWIFGSVAKQSETAGSDVDVMLVGDDLVLGQVLERLLPLEPELGRKINPVCYSVADFNRRMAEPESFIRRVFSQPVILLIGTANESDSAR